jgi:hypothetical protein
MMQPYVVLRGLASGKISHKINEKFNPERQPMLAIGNEQPFAE